MGKGMRTRIVMAMDRGRRERMVIMRTERMYGHEAHCLPCLASASISWIEGPPDSAL